MKLLWQPNQGKQANTTLTDMSSRVYVSSTAFPSGANVPHASMKQIRASLNEQAGMLILYLVVMQLIGPAIAAILITLMQAMHHQSVSLGAAFGELSSSSYVGLTNLICVASAFVFWILTHKSQIADTSSDGVFHRSERRMPPLVFIGAVCLLFTCQSLSTIYNIGFSWVVQQLNLEVVSNSERIQAASGTVAMLVYASLFGPIVEEIIFRGVIMKGLQRYGKVFAIVTSSAMFGFFHSDVSQGLFAFSGGLLLGYIASEYSIFWSILLHIVNNMVISNIDSVIFSALPEEAQFWTNLGFLVLGIVLGVLVLYLARVRIKNFITANHAYKGVYASWASFWFVVFIIIQLLVTAMEFSPVSS
ncbi:CPBP family intramembrane glutamic endopeptidase [Bombiscardovia coagulans]|uniref:CAAX protease self-immunity n=1 Tax=Bombiscardovia coagulans TaxID=686666 RepID=A0A261EVL4_9BIFI|nr:CPBP family intramembrane glutamic endopeptidase [Bombiscardovia coagulans]OZG50696.1 CAAX protease self-immunity [Bombiscardovia coagulans]